MKTKIEPEEKEILEAYELGTVKPLTPSRKEIEEIKVLARNTLRKDRRVTIRLYDHDLKGIQKKALEKGVPYQTLISSMIHQYVEGDLVETKTG
jgi:predicted DNA binding CopG/RHH family protein